MSHRIGIRLGIVAVVLVCPMRASSQSTNVGRMFEDAARKVARSTVKDALERTATSETRPGVSANLVSAREYTVKTQDGWTLVAHRYPRRSAPRPGALPVILCHGLSYNAKFWSLDPNANLPEYLSRAGYDVWVVDLRGSGQSTKWVAKLAEAPEMLLGDAVRRLSGNALTPTGYATVDPKFSNWTLDHHIAFDVPAFVRLVRRETQAAQVTWIGHSMGGIVALCHLARHGNPGIGNLVTVGSQVTMPNAQLPLQFLREMVSLRTRQLTGRLTAEALAADSRTSVHNMFFNQSNVSPNVYQALGSWATDIPSIGVMQQYMTLGMGGELLDSRKQFNYAKALNKVDVPILITCGADDQFAPPPVQRYLYDSVGSTDKTLIVFGTAMGFSTESGHDDALVGLNSQAQVYPTIEAWLRGARPRK